MADTTIIPQAETERVFAAKRVWNAKQAKLPLKEKVRILLKMQRDDYSIPLVRVKLRSWEKPWNVRP